MDLKLKERLLSGEKMTIGEAYDEDAAREYFELLVRRQAKQNNILLKEAIKIEKANLRYYAGYYSRETRRRGWQTTTRQKMRQTRRFTTYRGFRSMSQQNNV